MEEEAKKTKKCPRCESVLPVSEFYKNKSNKDGLTNWCKKCTDDYLYAKRHNGKQKSEIKTEEKFLNAPSSKESDLRRLTSRKLIEELRLRGFSGTLTYTQKINV